MGSDVTMAATVWEVAVDPQRRDPRRPYLVRLRVDEVYEGDLPGDRLCMLIADVAGVFRQPDPVGVAYLVTLTTPVGDPHTGPVEVEPADDDREDD